MPEAARMVEVAAAIIRDAGGRYLIVRRRPGTHLAGLWEFPGGKREAGESITACLQRELTEELSAAFNVEDKVETIHWDYGDRRVVLHFFHCCLASGTITPGEGQELAWVAPEHLRDYAFPPADEALVRRLLNASRETA